MAVSGSIDLRLDVPLVNPGVINLLEQFREVGWGLNYIGKIMYLSLVDVDFDWTGAPL